MRRDLNLETTAGLTVEFRMEIKDHGIANIQRDSVRFVHTSAYGQIQLVFSPQCIKVSNSPTGSLPTTCESSSSWNAISYDATQASVYRLVINAKTDLRFKLYMTPESELTALSASISGVGSSSNYVRVRTPGVAIDSGDSRFEFPNITLGETTHNTWAQVLANVDTSGAYAVDYIRYSPGIYHPGAVVTATAGAPESLPLNLKAQLVRDSNNAVLNGIEFSSIPILGKYEEWVGITLADGVGHLLGERATVVRNSPYSIKGNGSWTLELRAKVGKDQTDRASGLVVYERMGAVALLISKNKVELSLGYKQKSLSVPVSHDNTSAFRTYRLVKFEGSPHVFLFIDNESRPVIADFKLSAFSMNSAETTSNGYEGHEMRLTLGFSPAMLMPTMYDPGPDDYPNWKGSTQDLYVDYLRWSPTAILAHTY